jgi:hypothetical protein
VESLSKLDQSIKNYTVKFKNGGIIFSRQEAVMFFPVDENKKGVFGPMKLIDIAVDINNFTVKNVFPSLDYDQIVIFIQPIKKFHSSGMLLVWNTKTNKEIKSFSIEAHSFSFVNGMGSKAGYILIKTNDENKQNGVYVNLDNMILNPYFEADFDPD